jgi:hypothetical protein
MKSNNRSSPIVAMVMMIFILACSAVRGLPNAPFGAGASATASDNPSQPEVTQAPVSTVAANPLPTFAQDTPTPTLTHILTPGDAPKALKHIFDVTSADTASEKRAPQGDSYKINRFERPFTQDMTYIADADIASYSFAEDNNFFYASIELVGSDPNNPIGIDYGVEIDLNGDGFGDDIIWAHPPYTTDWSTDNVQIFADQNHDTGGVSAEKSDAPLKGDGYETLIYSGGRGQGDDPDLAWVRINAGKLATVQFAFKKSLGGNRFMYGVIADAGLKDVTLMDYVDRFTESEAGSPEKSEKYYPLKQLYGVDNVCRETFGFEGSGEEPQLCPRP